MSPSDIPVLIQMLLAVLAAVVGVAAILVARKHISSDYALLSIAIGVFGIFRFLIAFDEIVILMGFFFSLGFLVAGLLWFVEPLRNGNRA